MKTEDLYEAVTELRDDQIAEGEKKLAGDRPARFRRLGTLAAALAVVVLAAAAAGLLLRRGNRIGGGVTAPSEASQPAQTRQPDDAEAPTEEGRSSDAQTDPVPEQPEGALSAPYGLAFASYPKMASYPVYGTMNEKEYEAAWQLWREDRLAMKPEGDYTRGLDVGLKRLIPALLDGTPGENRAASPLNVWMALAMLAETTDGRSRQELLELLNAPDLASLRTRANALWRASYCNDGLAASILGSSLWLREDRSYDRTTLRTLAEHYYASSFSGPMGAEDYNETLREWTNAQTGELLEREVEALSLSDDTLMALITTIYFQAPWSEEFYETETRSFHSPGGDTEEDFLLESSSALCWFGADFTAAGKSLREGGSMYFLLPREGVTPEALLRSEEAVGFLTDAAGRDRVENRYVHLKLAAPKFDVSAQMNLQEPLKALGVEAIFDPNLADFSPLTGRKESSIAVSSASHAARVMIDEKGVTAAAFTEVTAGAGEPSPEIVELSLDRPFLFVLSSEDGLPLFVGIVNQPTP